MAGTMVYNVNDTATQVLAAKQAKENLFIGLLHYNGKGLNEKFELNASTIRMPRRKLTGARARKLGSSKNGAFFNENKAAVSEVTEYDLNLLNVYDQVYDFPEVQQDMCPVDIFNEGIKDIAGEANTEINANTIAEQLSAVFNLAQSASSWDNLAVILDGALTNYLTPIMKANAILDNGDKANGVQSFPFNKREIIMRPGYKSELMSKNGVLIGGSTYAQSMIAKGTVSPETSMDFGSMYVGEINNVPCYICPDNVMDAAGEWCNDATTFDKVQAYVMAADATDRGISMPDRFKIIDAPGGAGKRIQPLVRWGVNVCFPKGIVPILDNGTVAPVSPLTVLAPGSNSKYAPAKFSEQDIAQAVAIIEEYNAQKAKVQGK